METNYGPTLKARERLSAEGRWDDCRAAIHEMAERRKAGGGMERPELCVLLAYAKRSLKQALLHAT